MNDLKSISQIAVNLGVSRQAVYSKLKSAELARAVKPLTVKQGNTTLYTLQAQELIKQAFGDITPEDFKIELTEFKEKCKVLSSELTSCKEQLESALQDVEGKSCELQAKEQTLNELTSCKVKLESQISDLLLKKKRTRNNKSKV